MIVKATATLAGLTLEELLAEHADHEAHEPGVLNDFQTAWTRDVHERAVCYLGRPFEQFEALVSLLENPTLALLTWEALARAVEACCESEGIGPRTILADKDVLPFAQLFGLQSPTTNRLQAAFDVVWTGVIRDAGRVLDEVSQTLGVAVELD